MFTIRTSTRDTKRTPIGFHLPSVLPQEGSLGGLLLCTPAPAEMTTSGLRILKSLLRASFKQETRNGLVDLISKHFVLCSVLESGCPERAWCHSHWCQPFLPLLAESACTLHREGSETSLGRKNSLPAWSLNRK